MTQNIKFQEESELQSLLSAEVLPVRLGGFRCPVILLF